MTQMREPLMPRRDDVQLLLWDLACVSGTLSEIRTVWRRAMSFPPELRLRRLMQIQDTARQLAADIGAAVSAGTGPSVDPASS
jgi:hypothetical protein